MAAESAKTIILVRTEFRPTVAKAAGESLMATRRRPNALRRTRPTSTAHRAAATATSMSSARSPTACMKGSRSRPTLIEVPSEMMLELSKKAEYMTSPKASVASAR